MNRDERFLQYFETYGGKAFMPGNVQLIYKNLEKAENDNCLLQFLMNKKPYRCSFPYITLEGGARGKDQIAIVVALNIYGATHPGFSHRLNHALKTLASGSAKKARSVLVLMAAQLELQQAETSIIDFVDRELIKLVNRNTRRRKVPMIILSIFFIVGGAIGMPGFTMLGLIPLTFGAIALFIYGIFSLSSWIGSPIFSDEVIENSVREVGDRFTDPSVIAAQTESTPK